MDLLEGYEQESSSMVGLYTGSGALGNDPNAVVTGSQQKLDLLEIQIDEVKNNFDGYEKYLYFESASFTTSSFGTDYDATWPKQNTSKPYVFGHIDDVTSYKRICKAQTSHSVRLSQDDGNHDFRSLVKTANCIT